MSRSGYSDDLDNWALIKWRGQVASAIRGKRGQRLLRDMIQALDALPQKRLIAEDLVNGEGEVCALGAVGLKRDLDLASIDAEDRYELGKQFDVADQLAAEVMFVNDEASYLVETPEQRWERVRAWAESKVAAPRVGPERGDG